MASQPQRILVVDDELGIREGCRKILLSEGYEVTTAEDGVAGLEVFRRGERFAAALLDLKMPRMGGIELIEQVRKLDEDIVLLVITAYATIATAVEATKKGAYGYIPKPFTPDELILAVTKGLETRAISLEAKRLRAEREKRLLEVAFERSKSNTIIHCITDGVVVVNRERQVVLRNDAAASVIPGLEEQLPPVALDQALQHPELKQLITNTLDSDDTSAITSRELAIGPRTYMANASPVAEPGHEILGAVVVLRDITARKQLEAAKSMFVSMVAHEVKNPLGAIQGCLQVVLSRADEDSSTEDRRMLRRALIRAKALREMLSDLMLVTSMEAGKFEISRTAVDIVPRVEEVIRAFEAMAQEKRVPLSLEVAGDDAHRPVLVDPSAMTCVFNNLVDNAIKYTLPGGTVRVGLSSDPSSVKVTVQDTGIGMSAEETKQIFEDFYRAKNPLAIEVPGTGLGLTIVRRLLELHHASISVESEPDVGTTFCVRIPLAETMEAGGKHADV